MHSAKVSLPQFQDLFKLSSAGALVSPAHAAQRLPWSPQILVLAAAAFPQAQHGPPLLHAPQPRSAIIATRASSPMTGRPGYHDGHDNQGKLAELQWSACNVMDQGVTHVLLLLTPRHADCSKVEKSLCSASPERGVLLSLRIAVVAAQEVHHGPACLLAAALPLPQWVADALQEKAWACCCFLPDLLPPDQPRECRLTHH